MSIDNEDKVDTVVAVVSGAIIGIAVTLLFFRMQGNRGNGSKVHDEDYYYDGGDLFV